MLIVITQI